MRKNNPNKRLVISRSRSQKLYARMPKLGHNVAKRPPTRILQTVVGPANPYWPQPYELGTRTVMVQGNEPLALDWLLHEKKIPASKIQHHSEHTIKPIRFMIRRTEYEYVPDILAAGKVVEVMNLWTLALEWNDAKFRAIGTREQGFDHRMLVPDGCGSVYCLPEEWTKRSFGWVETWFRQRQKPEDLRILSMDPGSSNFAWAIIHATAKGERKIIATGMIQCPIKTLMGDISDGINRFVHEVDGLISKYSPNSWAAERFMTRGNKGATIELINIMIGTLITKFSYVNNRRTKLLPASQWKNEFNRYHDLDQWYQNCGTRTVHQMDAIGIGLYCADYWFNVKGFSDPQLIVRMLKQLKLLKGEDT